MKYFRQNLDGPSNKMTFSGAIIPLDEIISERHTFDGNLLCLSMGLLCHRHAFA
jgi:hypothetical protein